MTSTAPPATSATLKPLLVCFSHLRWSFVYQRPQHLLSRAAHDYRVLFIEEPLFADVSEPKVEIGTGPGAVTVAVPVLPHGLAPAQRAEAQRAVVVDLIAQHGPVRVAWFYTPMALPFARDVKADVTVYDCMDELSGFKGAPDGLRRLELELMQRADVMFTGGVSLYEVKRDTHANIHAFPSSIDRSHFAKARDRSVAEPADQMSIPRPRAGFFGVVDERMNIGLVARTAELMPDWQFVMIGPVVKIDPASLPKAENIHWLGGRTYDELPGYLAGWDVGFMPFALNEATRYISPTKTPEFLAAGIPVVSTAIVDVVRGYGERGLVEIAQDAADLAAKIRLAAAAPRTEWLTRVDALLSGMSWDDTWARMRAQIETTAQRSHAARTRPKETALASAFGAAEVAHV